MELAGIDLSWRMIEYARAEAPARKLTDGVEFLVMDVLHPLEFPNASFDLVNMRSGSSFLLVTHWPRLLSELLFVTCAAGKVRLADAETVERTSALSNRMIELSFFALYRFGHHLSQ